MDIRVAGSNAEDRGSLAEEEEPREGVALLEGALEELEQARDLLASLEHKVWGCRPCAALLADQGDENAMHDDALCFSTLQLCE